MNRHKFDIICFSSQAWEEPMWTNKQHIMSRLAKRGHRVLFVDPPRLVDPYFRGSVYKVLHREPREVLDWLKEGQENLWVVSPRFLGFKILEFKGTCHFIQELLFLRRYLHQLNFQNRVTWVYHPENVGFVGKLGERFVAYDCVDEYSEFPIYSTPEKKREIQEKEKALMRHADIVFTTSQTLYEAKRAYNPDTYLVPNVGDADHFKKALLPETAIPEDIRKISHPIIGFVGAVDAYKMDFELIKMTAEKHRDWSFVFIGPIGYGDSETSVEELKKIPNIYLLGLRDYAVLPNYLKAFDVCTIPYKINRYTEHVFPIKVYEYLATGKPIVVTNMPALEHLGDMLRIARDYNEFNRMLEEAVEEAQNLYNPDAVRRVKLAEANSWEKRVEELLALIEERFIVKIGKGDLRERL